MDEDSGPLTDDAPSQSTYVFVYVASMIALLIIGVMYW